MKNLLDKIKTKLGQQRKAAIDAALRDATAKADAEYQRGLEEAKRTLALLGDDDIGGNEPEAVTNSVPPGMDEVIKTFASGDVILPSRGWKSDLIRGAIKAFDGKFTVNDVLSQIEKSGSVLPEKLKPVTVSGFLSGWAQDGVAVEIVRKGKGRRAAIYRNKAV